MRAAHAVLGEGKNVRRGGWCRCGRIRGTTPRDDARRHGHRAPELRSPILPFTAGELNARSLRRARLGFKLSTKPGPGVTMSERYVDSEPEVRVLITTPLAVGVQRPAVLLIHGGATVVGFSQFEAFEGGRLARELDAVIVSPDYRLAPEYAAPARRTDLSDLPPAWVGVGDVDIVYDEGAAYAEQLKACGVPCELVTVPGMYHAADRIKRKVLSMQDFRRGMSEHLRTYLRSSPC